MCSDERGQTTVMALGLAIVLFAVTGVAIDGTRAFLHRRTLQSAADAAVLGSVVTFDTAALYERGGIAIDAQGARSQVLRSIRERGLARAVADISVSVDEVVLVLRDRVPTSFLSLVGVRSIPVAVEAAAEPLVRP